MRTRRRPFSTLASLTTPSAGCALSGAPASIGRSRCPAVMGATRWPGAFSNLKLRAMALRSPADQSRPSAWPTLIKGWRPDVIGSLGGCGGSVELGCHGLPLPEHVVARARDASRPFRLDALGCALRRLRAPGRAGLLLRRRAGVLHRA